MPNAYWLGIEQAHLDREQIEAAWGSGEQSGTRIQFVNRAFEIFYQGRQRIRTCRNVEQAGRMERNLEDAARAGWGLGISDLEEAFEHLTANGGRWRDGATSCYFGGQNKLYQVMLIEAPVSAVNFVHAVDERLASIADAAGQHGRQAAAVVQALDSEEWTLLDRALGRVVEIADQVEPLLWLGALEDAPVALQRAASFADAAGALNDALAIFRSSIRAGFRPSESAVLATLRGALDYLPVLGNYYGLALDLVPHLRAWFSGLVDQYNRRIERAMAGARY